MYDGSHTDFFSTDLPTSNNPDGKNHEKNCSKTGSSRILKGIFSIELYKEINFLAV